MSKIALSGDAAGTGTFTIASPNSNSNFTLTLPAESGTIVTGASGLNATNLTSGTIPKARMYAGAVLQVVQSTITTETIFSSSTFADATNFNASITPSSTSSRVLVLMNVSVYLDNFNTGQTNIAGKIVRGSTDIYEALLINGYATNIITGVPFIFLDSPSSTSSVTYKLQVRASSSYNPSRINSAGSVYATKSTITLMEIAG